MTKTDVDRQEIDAVEPRPGDAVPARPDPVGELPVGRRQRRRLRVLQHPRDQPDPPQHHPRRGAAAGPRGPGALLLRLRRLRERRGLDPDPARRGHLQRGRRLLRRLRELRERQPRRTSRGSTPSSAAAPGAPAAGPCPPTPAASAAATPSGAASRRRPPTASATTRASSSTPAYLGATRQDERSLLKFFGFSGQERTQLAYLAADEATLETNLRANPLTPAENDHFGMDFAQLQYTRLVGSATTLMAQGYYNGAQGWFRIWDTPPTSLQQYGINGYFVGLVLGATHRQGRLSLNWGAHANDFTRDHFMDVVGGSRAYLNTGLKNEYSTFLKATWEAGRAQLWADAAAPLRALRVPRRPAPRLGELDLLQPQGRACATTPRPRSGSTRSVGRMGREPARSDMLNGEDNASVPYDLTVGQAGERGGRGGGGRAAPRRLPGAGRRLRDGVPGRDRAHGRAVRDRPARAPQRRPQLPARDRARPGLDAVRAMARRRRPRTSAATGSSPGRSSTTCTTRRGTWIGSAPRVYQDVPPLLAPEAILNGTVDWTPARDLGIGLAARYVGGGPARQHRQPRLPHALLRRPRPARDDRARPPGEEGRSAAARPGRRTSSTTAGSGPPATATCSSRAARTASIRCPGPRTITPRPRAACTRRSTCASEEPMRD